MDNLQILSLVYKILPYFVKPGQPEQPQQKTLSGRDRALLSLKQKDGAVIVILGTRDTGKSELAYRLAEFLGKPTYAVSPEQKPHPSFIRRITIEETGIVPAYSTILFDDLPVYASNRDYNEALVRELERLIPMVRHERKLHLIFASQNSAQADKYILDCDLAFFKPLGLLYDDLERPNIRRIYRNEVDQYFEGKPDSWIVRHAVMWSREYKGLIEIRKVDSSANVPIDVEGTELEGI